MKASIRSILNQDSAEKLLVELILAIEHIGLDYMEIVENYRSAIKKPLEENIEIQD
ncbi:hypothetical protein KJ966_01295 [bacterium]|nr:hypothetical protein [bacterium]